MKKIDFNVEDWEEESENDIIEQKKKDDIKKITDKWFSDGRYGKSFSYTYETFYAEALPMSFSERHYYLPIGQDRVNNNNRLIENPGY